MSSTLSEKEVQEQLLGLGIEDKGGNGEGGSLGVSFNPALDPDKSMDVTLLSQLPGLDDDQEIDEENDGIEETGGPEVLSGDIKPKEEPLNFLLDFYNQLSVSQKENVEEEFFKRKTLRQELAAKDFKFKEDEEPEVSEVIGKGKSGISFKEKPRQSTPYTPEQLDDATKLVLHNRKESDRLANEQIRLQAAILQAENTCGYISART